MNMLAIRAWLRQPTTITGLASVGSFVTAALAYWLTHDVETAVGAGGVLFGAVHLVVNDHTAMPSSLSTLERDALVALAQNKGLLQALPGLVSDGTAVARDLAASLQSAAPAPVPAPASSVAKTATGLLLAVGLGASLALSACGGQPSTQPVTAPVTWSQVVQKAKDIDAALDVLAAAAEADASIDPVTRAQIKAAVDGLDALTASLDGGVAPVDAKGIAVNVLNAIDDVVRAVPVIPPDVQMMESLAHLLLVAFIDGLPAPSTI